MAGMIPCSKGLKGCFLAKEHTAISLGGIAERRKRKYGGMQSQEVLAAAEDGRWKSNQKWGNAG